jgi:RNAse (barnase) inhibitor barstar
MRDLTEYLESILQPTISKVRLDDEVYVLEMPIKLEWYDYIDPENTEHTIIYMEYQIIKEMEKYFPNGLKYRIKRK